MSALPLTLQAGESSLDGSVDPRLGIVALRLKCWAPDLLTAVAGAVPAVALGLVENQPRTFSRDTSGEQGGYHVMVTLEGLAITGPEAEAAEEYTLDGTTSEDPIESHPNYPALVEIYQGDPDEQTGRARWPRLLGDAESGEQRRNPMHGVESYLVPGLVWTRRRVSRVLPGSLVAGLGTIETPPGRPPELQGNRNWLKVRARATWRGNVWQIEESWLLSGPEGWVPEMYQA